MQSVVLAAKFSNIRHSMLCLKIGIAENRKVCGLDRESVWKMISTGIDAMRPSFSLLLAGILNQLCATDQRAEKTLETLCQ